MLQPTEVRDGGGLPVGGSDGSTAAAAAAASQRGGGGSANGHLGIDLDDYNNNNQQGASPEWLGGEVYDEEMSLSDSLRQHNSNRNDPQSPMEGDGFNDPSYTEDGEDPEQNLFRSFLATTPTGGSGGEMTRGAKNGSDGSNGERASSQELGTMTAGFDGADGEGLLLPVGNGSDKGGHAARQQQHKKAASGSSSSGSNNASPAGKKQQSQRSWAAKGAAVVGGAVAAAAAVAAGAAATTSPEDGLLRESRGTRRRLPGAGKIFAVNKSRAKRTVHIKVEDPLCFSSCGVIRSALREVSGVHSVTVSGSNGDLYATYDPLRVKAEVMS
eukprot:GHVU01147742.1.p1 GENE.GHVU01147742.1~~GHVU01147742.1.p1  ORF type:complete len:328 (+),score=93.59 GHVU01147742.1:640-1623(+)